MRAAISADVDVRDLWCLVHTHSHHKVSAAAGAFPDEYGRSQRRDPALRSQNWPANLLSKYIRTTIDCLDIALHKR
ncbi:MAG: hypothetical protein AAGH38_10275, partial [Pseudomonadota bacterium]